MGQRFGSLMNLIADAQVVGAPEPEVGMGATDLMWSDRHAGTIVAVRRQKTGKRAGQVTALDWQRDRARPNIVLDENGNGRHPANSEFYDYAYERNPEAEIVTYTLRPSGRWIRKGWSAADSGSLRLGHREEYRDPSF